VKPDPAALEFAGRVACLAAIAAAIRTKLNPNPVDITEVKGDIAKLLDASITGVDMPAKPAPVMDRSKIDFEALRLRFKESKHKNTDLEVLKAAIRAQLEKLIRLNKTRADFASTFEGLTESYNSGSRNIEELFEELVKLSRNLSEEQQRHVRENMTEEELVIFDILTRPAPELSTDERTEVKKVARLLLARIKQLLVLNWHQKSAARAQLRLAVEDMLESGLPQVCSRELCRQKCSALQLRHLATMTGGYRDLVRDVSTEQPWGDLRTIAPPQSDQRHVDKRPVANWRLGRSSKRSRWLAPKVETWIFVTAEGARVLNEWQQSIRMIVYECSWNRPPRHPRPGRRVRGVARSFSLPGWPATPRPTTEAFGQPGRSGHDSRRRFWRGARVGGPDRAADHAALVVGHADRLLHP